METKETTITDEVLDKAAEVATGSPEVAEPVVPEAQPNPAERTVLETKIEETDQQFRSALGRRVSRIETSMNDFIQEMRGQMLNQNRLNQPHDPAETPEEFIGTAEDVRRVVYRMEQEKQQKVTNYENNYLNHLARLGLEEELDDRNFKRLEELTKTSFNQTYSNYQDPQADAERNFLKAMRVIDRERIAKPSQINLKGDIPKGTGVSFGGSMIKDEIPEIALDKYAQDFVNYHKIPKEKIAKVLGEKVKK